MQKIYKKILFNTILVTFLLFIGMVIGILGMGQYTKIQTEKVAQAQMAKLITDKIAIVNLDTGVMVDEENVNYANKLLTDLEDNFLFTGLEDARTGYETGIYAGYMVIPATFSQGVVSLNDMPVRTEITYAINEELTPEVKEQVIYDVMEFMAELDDKISYMYMHSVMDEFHDAQDEADIVMKNDLAEKEAINAIEAKDLVTLAPATEITEVENNIEPVDVSEYMALNLELTSQVGTKYREYIMESEVEHQKLNESATSLMKEMSNMDPLISAIDFMHDSEGNSIYQQGKEELQQLFEAHNTTLRDKEVQLQGNVIATYDDIQTFTREYLRLKEAYLLATGVEFDDYIMDEEGIPKVDEEGNNILLSTLFDKYAFDLTDEEQKNQVLESQLGVIEKMDIASVEQVVEEKVLNPVQEKADTTTQAIMEQYAIEKEQLTVFSDAVMEYDPLKYIDEDEIQGITTAMLENAGELSEAILETDMQQMEYVTDVYESTRNDLANMQDVIKQAKEESDKAVADGLANLQLVKNTNSELNQAIMYDFSEKLPYTRLGSVEYTQAYEFMANPLGYKQMETEEKSNTDNQDMVKTESDSVSISEDNQMDYQIIGLILGTIICAILVGYTIMLCFPMNKKHQLMKKRHGKG